MILFLLEVYITIPLHSSRPYYHHDSANTRAGSSRGFSAEVGGAQPSHLTPPDHRMPWGEKALTVDRDGSGLWILGRAIHKLASSTHSCQ